MLAQEAHHLLYSEHKRLSVPSVLVVLGPINISFALENVVSFGHHAQKARDQCGRQLILNGAADA